jgi:Cd2+/Zn2+-exporting ATPase
MLPMAPAEPAPGPEPNPEAERYRVEGMDCAACAQTVEKVVVALDGVRAARVSFGNATLAVEGDVKPERVTAAVARAGYRAAPLSRRRAAPTAPFWRRDARTISTLSSVALLTAAVAATLAGAGRAVAEPLYLASMAIGGWPIARAALAGVRRRSLDMNVLMTLAAVGAVGIGAYAEGAWVLVLFAVGTDARDLRVRPQPPLGHRADGARARARARDRRRRRRAPRARRGGDRRHALRRAAGRAHRARRRRGRRRLERRRGADHRRVGARSTSSPAARCSPARSTPTAR